jgi:hypothetical protein
MFINGKNFLQRRPAESDAFPKEVSSLIHRLGEQAADHVDQLAITFGFECGEFFFCESRPSSS